MKRAEHLRDSVRRTGVSLPGRELRERDQHKIALAHPRMGNLKSWFADSLVSENQNIQVQGARAIANTGRTVTSVLFFDAQQGCEQSLGIELCFKSDDRIEKSRLIGEAHRRGGIERRACHHRSQGTQPRGGSGHRGLGIPGRTRLVRTHADIDLLHALQTIAMRTAEGRAVGPIC